MIKKIFIFLSLISINCSRSIDMSEIKKSAKKLHEKAKKALFAPDYTKHANKFFENKKKSINKDGESWIKNLKSDFENNNLDQNNLNLLGASLIYDIKFYKTK